MSIGIGRGRGWDAAAVSRTFGRGRARFSAQAVEDPHSEALLRRQLEAFAIGSAEPPLTPVTPNAPRPPVVEGQFADFRSEAGASSPPLTPGATSGSVTPQRRPRYGSEGSSSSFPSTPHSTISSSSTLSSNFLGDDHPDCVCNRDKKMVICRMCGHTYNGRVRRRCTVHFNVRMLMDNDLCKPCGIPCLFECDVQD